MNTFIYNVEYLLGRHISITNIQNTFGKMKLPRQWKLMKDAPQDIFGHHEMKFGASELRR
jgi:hypothetical protein